MIPGSVFFHPASWRAWRVHHPTAPGARVDPLRSCSWNAPALECALELPTTRVETRTRKSQVPAVPAKDSSTAVWDTRAIRRQQCRGHLRLFHNMLAYLLPAYPVTQHKLPLLRAHGLLRRLSHIITVQYWRREPACPARTSSARIQFRRREHALVRRSPRTWSEFGERNPRSQRRSP